MKRTGVCLTKRELAELRKLENRRFLANAMAEKFGPLPEGNVLQEMYEKITELAVNAHGLPRVRGFYGLDLRTGEVISFD